MIKPNVKQQEEDLFKIRKDVALGRVKTQGSELIFRRISGVRGTLQLWAVDAIVSGIKNIGWVEWAVGLSAYSFRPTATEFGLGAISTREISEFCSALNLSFHKTRL